MNFKTYEDLTECIIRNIHKLPRDIDVIVGIPRSGTMVGNIIALYLNIPFTDIDTYLNGGAIRTGTTRKCRNWIRRLEDAKHVLIVDDSVSSGKAIKEVKQKIEQKCSEKKTTYLAIYALLASCKKVDIYFEICEQPRMFEWNYMHHWALEHCCMDIDGVLCEDPTFFENDDGKRYIHFLETTLPKFIPTQKVGYLVSSRLEKYREYTEQWLKKYGVEYGQLMLMNNCSAKERAISNKHAEYKAEVYKNSGCILFFESDYEQALRICEISGKPVFCVGNKKLITSNNVRANFMNYQKEFRVTTKRIVKKMLKKIRYVK